MRTKNTRRDALISAYRLLEARFKEPVKSEYQKGWNDALTSAVEQETDLIQHVGYSDAECGYEK